MTIWWQPFVYHQTCITWVKYFPNHLTKKALSVTMMTHWVEGIMKTTTSYFLIGHSHSANSHWSLSFNEHQRKSNLVDLYKPITQSRINCAIGSVLSQEPKTANIRHEEGKGREASTNVPNLSINSRRSDLLWKMSEVERWLNNQVCRENIQNEESPLTRRTFTLLSNTTLRTTVWQLQTTNCKILVLLVIAFSQQSYTLLDHNHVMQVSQTQNVVTTISQESILLVFNIGENIVVINIENSKQR